MPLSPGHAAICGEQWRHLKWNDAVPLVDKEHGGCEKHELKNAVLCDKYDNDYFRLYKKFLGNRNLLKELLRDDQSRD